MPIGNRLTILNEEKIHKTHEDDDRVFALFCLHPARFCEKGAVASLLFISVASESWRSILLAHRLRYFSILPSFFRFFFARIWWHGREPIQHLASQTDRQPPLSYRQTGPFVDGDRLQQSLLSSRYTRPFVFIWGQDFIFIDSVRRGERPELTDVDRRDCVSGHSSPKRYTHFHNHNTH